MTDEEMNTHYEFEKKLMNNKKKLAEDIGDICVKSEVMKDVAADVCLIMSLCFYKQLEVSKKELIRFISETLDEMGVK